MSEQQNDHLDLSLAALAGEQFCYLTTTGRMSGHPHEIEIWFAANAGRVYLLSELGERADWVQNLRKTPEAGLRIGNATFSALARVVAPGEEDALARQLIAAKYEGWHQGEELPGWTQTATPVVIQIRAGA